MLDALRILIEGWRTKEMIILKKSRFYLLIDTMYRRSDDSAMTDDHTTEWKCEEKTVYERNEGTNKQQRKICIYKLY